MYAKENRSKAKVIKHRALSKGLVTEQFCDNCGSIWITVGNRILHVMPGRKPWHSNKQVAWQHFAEFLLCLQMPAMLSQTETLLHVTNLGMFHNGHPINCPSKFKMYEFFE